MPSKFEAATTDSLQYRGIKWFSGDSSGIKKAAF
jgi:hypothetical protein